VHLLDKSLKGSLHLPNIPFNTLASIAKACQKLVTMNADAESAYFSYGGNRINLHSPICWLTSAGI